MTIMIPMIVVLLTSMKMKIQILGVSKQIFGVSKFV